MRGISQKLRKIIFLPLRSHKFHADAGMVEGSTKMQRNNECQLMWKCFVKSSIVLDDLNLCDK